MKNTLIIATRESPLALWQANCVKTCLEKRYPSFSIQLLGLTTEGDNVLETPLTKIGGKGLFVKELEEALFDGRADIAVHSMKDVPMELPERLCLPVICERFDPRDVFVSNRYESFMALPSLARIGTSSLRRQSQMNAWRTDLQVMHLRGNVNTRLDKLDQDEYDAIILAAAGLKRLGLDNRIRAYFSITECLPAPGQGVLGIECRTEDFKIHELIAFLHHPMTAACVTAERAMAKRLGGGCQVPVAAYADIQAGEMLLLGLVAHPSGAPILRTRQIGLIENAEKLGIQAAEDLLHQGAMEILCLVKKS